jgi:hypothetical protein
LSLSLSVIAKNSSKTRQQRRQKHLDTTVARLSFFGLCGRRLVDPKYHCLSLSLSLSLVISFPLKTSFAFFRVLSFKDITLQAQRV